MDDKAADGQSPGQPRVTTTEQHAPAAIRVVIVEDHPVVRTGIRTVLEQADGIEVVAETGDGKEVMALVKQQRPHVLLLDIELPGRSGTEIAAQVRKETSAVRVLALSAYDNAEYVHTLLLHGAAGYLTKEEATHSIVEAVRGVARGEDGWFSRRVVAKLSTLTRATRPDVQALTPREREVLGLLAAGMSNQEIGDSLGVRPKTVEKHVGAILHKFGVNSRVEAAILAIQQGIV